VGAPDAYLEAGAIEAAVDRVITSLNEALPQPRAVIGNYVFRDVVHYPLTIAGYLFAAERWVPRLSGNVAVHTAAPVRARLLEPRLRCCGRLLARQPGVTAEASIAALTEQLVHEVRGLVSPLIDAFRTPATWRRRTGGRLPRLTRVGIPGGRPRRPRMDAAWQLWAEAIAGRTFPDAAAAAPPCIRGG